MFRQALALALALALRPVQATVVWGQPSVGPLFQ